MNLEVIGAYSLETRNEYTVNKVFKFISEGDQHIFSISGYLY